MSDSELIRKNTLVNDNILTSGHLIKLKDISYKFAERQTCLTGNKNFEISFNKDLAIDLEPKFYPEKTECECDNIGNKKETNLSKFEDFKNLTNDLNNPNFTSIFNPFCFLPFLKSENTKKTSEFSTPIPSSTSLNSLNSLNSFNELSFSDSIKSQSTRNSSTTFTSTTAKFLSDEEYIDSASEKETNFNNYNNSIKLKDNQSMTPTWVSTRSSCDLVSQSSPNSFNEKTQAETENSVKKVLGKITQISDNTKLNLHVLRVKLEKNILGKSFITNFSHKKRERVKEEIVDDINSTSLPKLKREDAVFFHIEKKLHKRKRKNKFQKVMDLLKDSVLSESSVKNSILENLKENFPQYSHQEFTCEMRKIENHNGHSLMKKYFPNVYTLENFYKNFVIKETRRNENYHKIFIEEKWLNTFCNPNFYKKKENNYFLMNNPDSTNSQNLPKKIWAPSKEENLKDFINKIEIIWPRQNFSYSEELLLEYLMCLNYDFELVCENILKMSTHFIEFLENKKEVSKIEIKISQESSDLIKVGNISSRHYYLRKR